MQPQFIPLPTRAKNITNQRFGRLVALGPITKAKSVNWLCQCDCGNTAIVRADHLTGNSIQSCGCLRLERVVAASIQHGMFGTKIYSTWSRIVQRCTNPNNARYPDYGGRDIKICADWQESFEAFHLYVARLPHFSEKGYTIDRINNNGDYEPGNVRWATSTEQHRNTRKNRLLTFNAKTQCFSAWEEELGLRKGQIWERLHRGWSVEKTLTTPRN